MASKQQTASLDSGLTVGTTIHPYDGTDPQTEASASGTSIFDPVLCEIAYRWFSPPDAVVLDPFAGGSVRAVVASRLGRRYVGIDLREEQVAANRAQLKLCNNGPKPKWIVGDATEHKSYPKDLAADLIFTCPPFWNLERYSDDPRDLSTMSLDKFLAAQQLIIAHAVVRLKPDRFAVWVTSDVRDEKGFYVGLPGLTVHAFVSAGLRLYNEAILVTAAGSLPIRVRRQFEASRKLGRTHQVVQVYCKGDPVKATQACGECEFGELTLEGIAQSPAAGELLDLSGEV